MYAQIQRVLENENLDRTLIPPSFHNVPSFCHQKKIMRLIFYIKKKYGSITDHFYSGGILTVHELYVHELLKFCLQSVNEMHSTVFLNSFFTKTEYMRKRRKSEFLLFSEPFCKTNTRSNSLKRRGSRLLNLLSENKILPENLCSLKKNETNFLIRNIDLVKHIFSCK